MAERKNSNDRRIKHGHVKNGIKSKEYETWSGMLGRTRNPNATSWPYYGARGISVCERWLIFKNFLDDMGPRPAGTTLDRIDCKGNYEKSNCRWASEFQQKTNTSRTVKLTFNGQTLSLLEWSILLKVNYNTIESRVRRGWSTERTLSTMPPTGN